MLRDKEGKKLEDGIYIGPDPVVPGTACIYEIKVKGEEFTAESWDGYNKISDFGGAATNFTKLEQPWINKRFLESKLKEIK